jgi:hypothetical protein
MKLFQSLLLIGLFAGLSFSATTSVHVAKVGGESGSACSESFSDGTTAGCHAVFTTGRGTAVSSYWQYATNSYIWMGDVHRTITSTSNIEVWSRAFFDTEFANISTSGHGVTVQYDISGGGCIDCAAVNVYADDGFGNYTLVGTIDGNTSDATYPTSLNVNYSGAAIKIELEAIMTGSATATDDENVIQHVDLSEF